MNFFDTLIHPDREEHPERAEVARAANLLQVGEFQLLQLAHREWFDRDMATRETDRLFGAYMLHNQVPYWARHYARRIIALDAAGMLDDHDPVYHRYDPDPGRALPTGTRRFAMAAAAVAICVFGGIWTAHVAAHQAGAARSQLPPYFSDQELKRPPADR